MYSFFATKANSGHSRRNISSGSATFSSGRRSEFCIKVTRENSFYRIFRRRRSRMTSLESVFGGTPKNKKTRKRKKPKPH